MSINRGRDKGDYTKFEVLKSSKKNWPKRFSPNIQGALATLGVLAQNTP